MFQQAILSIDKPRAVYCTCIWHKIQRFQSSFVAGSMFYALLLFALVLFSVCLVCNLRIFALRMFSSRNSSADNGFIFKQMIWLCFNVSSIDGGFQWESRGWTSQEKNINSSMTDAFACFGFAALYLFRTSTFGNQFYTHCVPRIRLKFAIKESFPLIFFDLPILWQWKVCKRNRKMWKE